MYRPSERHNKRSITEEEWIKLNCTDAKFDAVFRQELEQFD